jgi:hypothetical protein
MLQKGFPVKNDLFSFGTCFKILRNVTQKKIPRLSENKRNPRKVHLQGRKAEKSRIWKRKSIN